jgi:hypothetical protein
MGKYKHSTAYAGLVDEGIAPRKDKHIVAPCLQKEANTIITHDRGLLQKKAYNLGPDWSGSLVPTRSELSPR